uniref:Uncharacterized protein n=1 Tax=Mola mola TaxID=94237 RepID=A0A3Q3WFZ4_MOLML
MMSPWKQIVLLSITGCLAWSLNGTLIDLENDYRRHMSGGSLIISSLDKDQDTGLYQCTAFNTWGSILSGRASLQFADLDNFKSQAVRKAVNVREGQGVVLLCGPPVNSGLTFAWIFNEYPHFVQQDSRRFISQETGSLYIAKVEPTDVGNYTCMVNNTVTRENMLSSPTPLVLRSDVMGEYEPKIEVNFPDSVPAAKESVVKLECFALGPVPEISWRRTSGIPFPSKVKLKNSNAVLEIPNFQQEDAGTYECMAENRRGKNTARGRLSFHKPQWLQTVTDTALSIEENLFWECKANGKPKPSYSWLKNGEHIMAEGRVQIENGAISIAALNLSDSGMYQCVAENKHGIIYSSAQLMVLSAPSFSKSPLEALLKARSGSEVTFECKPQASPPAISLWKKGKEVLQRTEITLLPNGTLKIANVTRRDAGSYTCIAKNQFGAASTTRRLLITEPTRITMRPTNMEIIVGESIVLPCQIACDPALDVSFSWAFNGQLINFQQDSYHFERVGGSVSGDLMIRNIQLNHGGKYVCVIDTDVESLSTSAILVVKPPGPPDKVTVEEITDSTAQLSWTPGRDNGSPITGYIIQARMPFSVGWQAVDTPELVNGNMLTATVAGLNAWVEYEFRVVARNAVGLGAPSPASAKTRTEDAPDTAPTDVRGGGGTKSELVITWEPVPEELQNGDGFGYIIAFRPVGTVTWTRAVISTPGVARYVFRNDTIPAFSPFDVKVGAYNNRGEGPFSSIATVYSAEAPSMAPKRVWTRSVSAVQIELIWEALPALPERVLGYEQVVYWEDDTKPDTVGKVRISGNYTMVLITGLKANTVYYLSVAAFNTAGPGPQSLPINTTTKEPPDRAPLNIQWTMIGSTLSLHWDPVVALETESKVTGYLQVLLKRHRFNDITTLMTNKTTVELTLSANDNYLIQIKAMSEGGEGVGSEPIHIHKLMGARGSGTSRLSPPYLSAVLISALLSS